MAPPSADSAALASLFTGENAAFLDESYAAWRRDPTAVEPGLRGLFATWQAAEAPPDGPSFRPRSIFNPPIAAPSRGMLGEASLEGALRQARVAQLINAYRVRGHTEAIIDPLGMREILPHPELTIEYYGLSETDLDLPVSGHPMMGVPRITTLRHILRRLRTAYCGSFGVEFMNIGDPDKKAWLQQRLETLQDRPALSLEEKRRVYKMISDAESFEGMLHGRFPGTKRFSIEGGEGLIPLLALLLDRASEQGVSEVILGMSHRGRLNVLANILEKPIRFIIDEFEDNLETTFQGSGDVKYHLGYASDFITDTGKELRVSLAFNPSHLEAVDPVVEGRCRARQDRLEDSGRTRVMALILHGDAAFAGQGLVAETLNLSGLHGYRTGGTIHLIINNQIGFTTPPADARSTPYCTDVARMLMVPIFHVNGEDPFALAEVARLAAEWRQAYHQDVIIDMWCFRRHGHNEGDEPAFTQPLMVEAIGRHPQPRVVFGKRLSESPGSLPSDEQESLFEDSKRRLEVHLKSPVDKKWDSYVGNTQTQMGRLWARYMHGLVGDVVETAVDRDRLTDLLVRANTVPAGFQAHRKIKRLLQQRLEMASGQHEFDWALAEQAAYATLLAEGYRIRLSGQDSGRGTFSHRHAVLTDIRSGDEIQPLQHLGGGQGPFDVFDSMLSEAGVLGFEFGYSLEWPDGLVLWEAQFGDFANGAQVIIDNFIMASEQKWGRKSGVVLLLPHGFEGQGPEHSSARLERWLQLCAEDNVIVANCTTPASFFHLLRRQVHLKTRKPLVVMSPKSLLRHPECTSPITELCEGRFREVLPDEEVDPTGVRRVVFCSGKLFYELRAARRERAETRVALVRLEQLHPFPVAQVLEILRQLPSGVEVAWCQEEPRNMGAWPMMDEWLGEAIGRVPRYFGRRRAASPASGSPRQHRAEQQALIDAALSFDEPGA